jgi:hypothetical protein
VSKLRGRDRQLARLGELVALRDMVDEALRQQVAEAHAAGISSVAIARAMRVSPQAVFKRIHGGSRARPAQVEGGTDA